jgi:hypothetical protein
VHARLTCGLSDELTREDTFPAARFDGAALHVHEPPDDRQSDVQVLESPFNRSVGLAAALEDVRQELRGNALASRCSLSKAA